MNDGDTQYYRQTIEPPRRQERQEIPESLARRIESRTSSRFVRVAVENQIGSWVSLGVLGVLAARIPFFDLCLR
jgi:hypothetical protein